MTVAGAVPMHPERGELPGQIRWIIPAGVLRVRGSVTAPGELGGMQADGTITEITVGPRSVVLTAEPGRWRLIGPAVRTALTGALRAPEDWHESASGGAGSGADGSIAEAAREVIGTQVGEYVRSHGGRIELIDVRDGMVTVELAGACRGCPAAAATLRSGFEAELRRRCRDVVGVRAVEDH